MKVIKKYSHRFTGLDERNDATSISLGCILGPDQQQGRSKPVGKGVEENLHFLSIFNLYQTGNNKHEQADILPQHLFTESHQVHMVPVDGVL